MGYLFLIIAMTLNAGANVLLKVGAARLPRLDDRGALGMFATNWYLIAGIALFAANVIFYAAALARLDLSVAYPVMMAGGVVIVVSISFLILHETLGSIQLLGLLFLIIGLILVTAKATP